MKEITFSVTCMVDDSKTSVIIDKISPTTTTAEEVMLAFKAASLTLDKRSTELYEKYVKPEK